MSKPRRKRRLFLPLKTPQQARARVTYASMLDAAARLLVTRGYAALTTNHVAETAGVAIGSFYEYFPDKETVVAEVVRRTLREIREELDEGVGVALRVDEQDGIESALRTMVPLLFRVVEKRHDLVRAFSREVPFVRELDEVDALFTELLGIASHARPLGKSPLFHAAPEAATFILTTMVANTVLEAASSRSDRARRDIEDTLIESLLLLLRPEP